MKPKGVLWKLIKLISLQPDKPPDQIKKEKAQISNIRNERGNITTAPTEIKMISNILNNTIVACQKDTGARLKRVSLAKSGTTWALKMV